VRQSEAVEHTPVLLSEVIAGLAPGPSSYLVDGTLGLGGHASALLNASAPNGRLLGIDADPQALAVARERLGYFGSRVEFVQGNVRDLAKLAAGSGFIPADAILLDLGVSSLQLGATGRGFSFQFTSALDMRMDPSLQRTAADLVNELSESELSHLLRTYGEEPQARRVARAVIGARPLHTTTELAATVRAAIGRHGARIDPVTRTFQALRIAVNDELESLARALEGALAVLRPGGRLAVISFHSLEDRIVKQFLVRESSDCVCPPALAACACSHRASVRRVSRRAITPTADEIARNPRSRSAKLRLAERLPRPA
jgi:16S rRNA (cytosine1402-N4)-methyltransferase